MKKTGTTVFAMCYKDGIVIAGDRRMSDFHYHIDDYVKVEETGNGALIAGAGVCALLQDLIQMLISWRERLEMLIEVPIYIDGQAELLKNILKSQGKDYFFQLLGLGAIPILAGFNPKTKTGMVFGFDDIGGIYERKDYVVIGSGQELAHTVLDDRWSPKMNLAEARELAILALLRASRDNFTAPPNLAPATVFSSSKEGVEQMQEAEALALAKRLYETDSERRAG